MVSAIKQATGRIFSAEERYTIAHGADEIVNSGLEETMITAYRQIHEQRTRDSRITRSAHGGVSQRVAQGGHDLPRAGDLSMTYDLVI
jgi:hypothetical protein